MRVLQLHNRYRLPGGEDRTAEMDAAMLSEGGHEVYRLEVENPAGGAGAALALAASPWNVRQAGRVKKEVKRFKPDVAHVHNTWFTFSPAVIRALRAQRIPTVVTFQNFRPFCSSANLFRDGEVCTDCVGHLQWRGVKHGCYRNSRPTSAAVAVTAGLHGAIGTWSGADGILVPSRWMRDFLTDRGYPRANIHVSPWACDDPGPRSGLPSESRDIIYMGRLEESKGIRMLLGAWQDAGSLVGDLRLRVIGDGPLRGEVEAAGPGVEYTPWLERSELNKVLLGARAVVCPSIWHEVFGQVVTEGYAAGMPVLVTDRGDLPELVEDVDPQLSVAVEDRSGWISALAGLGDDQKVDGLGAKARALYESRYSWSAGRERLTAVYESVVSSEKLGAR